MQRNHFDTEHRLCRDAFAAFLGKADAGVVDRSVWRKAGDAPTFAQAAGVAGG